ncbi:MAG: hypothetical protein AAF798_02405 [Bacteroidota bacterium]
MTALETILIGTHIAAGAAVLASGPMAMLTQKVGNGHRKAGLFYFWGMFTIFASAMLLLTLVRFNLFLLVIGIFSFYLSFSGYRVLKRKLPNQANWLDWGGALLSIVAGIGLFVVGLKLIPGMGGSVHLALPMLCMLFGFFTFDSARKDVVFFLTKDFDDKIWWKYHHMQAMIGSYIAAVTAFIVQIGGHLAPTWDYQWVLWLLPAAILSPIMGRWIKKEKAKDELVLN